MLLQKYVFHQIKDGMRNGVRKLSNAPKAAVKNGAGKLGCRWTDENWLKVFVKAINKDRILTYESKWQTDIEDILLLLQPS